MAIGDAIQGYPGALRKPSRVIQPFFQVQPIAPGEIFCDIVPASACRITPIPGSLRKTRLRRPRLQPYIGNDHITAWML